MAGNANSGRRFRTGYSAKGVAEYLTEQIEYKPVRRGGTISEAQFLNGQRLTADHSRRIRSWASDYEIADLSAVDRLLLHYDLHLWEYEHWATQRYGTNTFFDATQPVASSATGC